MFQTNLIVNFLDGGSKTYPDVHPDQSFFLENGMLVIESLDGEKIWYIQGLTILDYYTECVRS